MQESGEEFDRFGIVVQRPNHKLANGRPADRVVADRQSSNGSVPYRQSAYCDASQGEATNCQNSHAQAA